MKTSSIQIQYNTEKLNLLRQYKEETELQTLYEKHVPAGVRVYLECMKEGVVL